MSLFRFIVLILASCLISVGGCMLAVTSSPSYQRLHSDMHDLTYCYAGVAASSMWILSGLTLIIAPSKLHWRTWLILALFSVGLVNELPYFLDTGSVLVFSIVMLGYVLVSRALLFSRARRLRWLGTRIKLRSLFLLTTAVAGILAILRLVDLRDAFEILSTCVFAVAVGASCLTGFDILCIIYNNFTLARDPLSVDHE